jgi:surface protein
MNYMFRGCLKLTSIPKLDTSNVTDMKYLFNGCKSLTTIPKLDTSKVSNTSYIFSRCSNLSLKSILLNKGLMDEFDDSIMNKYKNIISIDNIEDLDERKINILSKIFEE